MYALLHDVFGYKTEDIVVMLDTNTQTLQPTGANIKVCRPIKVLFSYVQLFTLMKHSAALHASSMLHLLCTCTQAQLARLVSLTAPGDALFFHYSGHGTQVPTDHDDPEVDGLDEAIVPVDMNLIVDDDLRSIFCQLPLGARMTMLADCCHSGTMMDHPILQLEHGHSTQHPYKPGHNGMQQYEGRDFRNRC